MLRISVFLVFVSFLCLVKAETASPKRWLWQPPSIKKSDFYQGESITEDADANADDLEVTDKGDDNRFWTFRDIKASSRGIYTRIQYNIFNVIPCTYQLSSYN